MTTQEALQLRDRFYRCETTPEEERQLVSLLLSDECPDELLADRHAIITLADDEAIANIAAQRPRPHKSYRIAAAIIGFVLVGGLAFAAWLASPKPTVSTSSQPERLEASLPPSEEMKARAFDNTPLADIMAMVAKHYGHHVAFADDSLRQLRITTTWNEDEPLSAFLENMNELDGLSFTQKGDTIFVEPKQEEGAE